MNQTQKRHSTGDAVPTILPFLRRPHPACWYPSHEGLPCASCGHCSFIRERGELQKTYWFRWVESLKREKRRKGPRFGLENLIIPFGLWKDETPASFKKTTKNCVSWWGWLVGWLQALQCPIDCHHFLPLQVFNPPTQKIHSTQTLRLCSIS